MKKIRIHNDIRISWGITTNGQQNSLEGKTISLKLVVYNRVIDITDLSVTGNVITFTFPASAQKCCGVYSIVCRISSGSDVNTIDTEAFELVSNTYLEKGTDNDNLALEVVNLSTDRDSSTIGKAATIRIKSTETLASGSRAYVRNVGTVNDAILEFGIPAGEKGDKGDGSSEAKLNTVLDNLNKSSLGTGQLPTNGGYLKYDGSAWVWANPSESSSGGSLDESSLASYLTNNGYATQTWVKEYCSQTGTAGLDEVKLQQYLTNNQYTKKSDLPLSYWGAAVNSQNKVVGSLQDVTNITMSGVLNIGGFKISYDSNGLKFDGNIYATGAITALGSSSSGGSGESGEGVQLTGLLKDIATKNPSLPSQANTVLSWDGSSYTWSALPVLGDTLKELNRCTLPTGDFYLKYSSSLGNFYWSSAGSSGDSTSGTTLEEVQTWVNQQGFLTSSSLNDYATKTWVQNQGYLTSHQSLSGYATQSWCNSRFLTSHQSLYGYATESWVQSQGYLTEHQSLADYLTKSSAASTYLGKSDNAVSASKLYTSRTIWGQSFNGTSNVTGALSSVTNITMSGSITIGDCVISYDATNECLKFSKSIASTGAVTAMKTS